MADSRFQERIGAMLLTFGAVAVIDVTALSLLTGKLRLWFPQWIDPAWQQRPDAWVTYSQSYMSGIFLIPVLFWAVDQQFLAGRSRQLRWLLWSSCAALFGFVAWWKGGLMLRFGKELEALGWIALTVVAWILVHAGSALGGWAQRLTGRRLLRGLLLGIAAFFLVMAIVDPLLQVGVHGQPWSTGLSIEVGFFVPAGLMLLLLAWRVNRHNREELNLTCRR